MCGTVITRLILPWLTVWSRGWNPLFRFPLTRTITILFPDGVLAIRKRARGWGWKSLAATDWLVSACWRNSLNGHLCKESASLEITLPPTRRS